MACSGRGDDSADPCEGVQGSVEIGTGDETFESLAEGDPVTMVHGPQGGWHMLGSVRVTGLEQIVSVHYTVEVASGEHAGALISDNLYKVALIMDRADSGHYPGMYGYLGVDEIASGTRDTPPELLSYETVTMGMDVTNPTGCQAASRLDVVATPDPADVDDGGP